MLTTKEIIQRLSGLDLLEHKLSELEKRAEKLIDVVQSHEARLIRIEALIELTKSQRISKKEPALLD